VLKGRKVQNLSVREAAVQALDRNLRVQIVAHDQELRESVVREAKAAFLPVFNVSAQFKNTNTFERKEELNVIRKLNRKYRRQDNIPGAAPPNDPRPFPVSTQFFDPFALPPGAPGGQIILVDPKDTAHYFVATPKPANRAGMATVEIFQFNAVNPPETLAVAGGNLVDANGNPVGTLVAPQGSALQFFNQHNLKLGYVDPLGRATVLPKLWNYQIASKKKPSDEMVSLGMTIEQQLPWGPALAITVAPTWHRQPYDGFGNDFGRSWFGSFTAAGFVPLPWTKNFGPYSPVDTSIKLAKQDRERSFWDFRAAVNNILREVDLRYLAMVNAIRNVESATANRKSVETLAGLTNELLNAQKVTVYSKDQLDGELQRVKRVEEDAWRAYVSASNAMVAFLNLEPDAVLLPVGYSLGLSQRMPYKAEEARAVALENRPELKSVSASVRAAEITLKFQKVQERPDVSLNGSATWSHTQFPNGDGFRGEGGIGFKSVGSALANTLGNHDVVNETYSGAFNRSLFQRGENARIKIAQGQLDQQQLGQRSVQNNVEQEVADALARLDSAKGALEAAKARVEAARNAYNGGLEQMKLARLTAFELLSKSQDLLSAEFRYTSVLTDYKQAETELLYAQGVLAGQFPERTAPSEFDKYRLNLLRSNQVLQFFSEEKGTKAP
jgi:outer membrane protein TolC